MKKRTMVILAIVLSAALIVGSTMAWFTANPATITNAFKAGTVDIVLHDNTGKYVDGERPAVLVEHSASVNNEEPVIVSMDETGSYVNPGDIYAKEIYVENTGNKNAYVRVQLTAAFEDNLNLRVVDLDDPAENWILGEDGWYYYVLPLAPEDVTELLLSTVTFAGDTMGNEYQGKKFNILVEAQSIQASNGAALDQWGVNPTSLTPASE